MSNDSSVIVSKVWNYAHVLKNAGVGYGDSIEVRAARALITYLRFSKLANQDSEDFKACPLGRAGRLLPTASRADGNQRPALRDRQAQGVEAQPRPPKANRPLQTLHLRRDRRARQSQPRHLLAQRRQLGRQRKPPAPGRTGRRDRRIPRSRAGRVPRGGGSVAH